MHNNIYIIDNMVIVTALAKLNSLKCFCSRKVISLSPTNIPHFLSTTCIIIIIIIITQCLYYPFTYGTQGHFLRLKNQDKKRNQVGGKQLDSHRKKTQHYTLFPTVHCGRPLDAQQWGGTCYTRPSSPVGDHPQDLSWKRVSAFTPPTPLQAANVLLYIILYNHVL